MPPTVTYELPDPDFEQYTWTWENEHAPGSQPPLTQDMFKGMFEEPDGAGPPRQIKIHGYSYSRAEAMTGESMPPPPNDGVSALERWEEKWLPRVNALERELREFDPGAVAAGDWEETLEAQATQFGKVFAGVHMQTVMPSGMLSGQFVEQYVACFGEGRRADGLALLQGFSNQTLNRAIQMWQLSRLIREDATLRAVLARPDVDLEAIGTVGVFGDRFQQFLDEWGSTMDMFVQDLPSWRENPSTPLALIVREAEQPDEASPMAAEAARRERRGELEVELAEAAEGSAEAAAVQEALRAAQEILPVRENHNFLCDQRLSAASRYRWLHIGEHLAAKGRLSRADDVFYLRRGELLEALEDRSTPEAAAVQERRELQAAIRATPPPATLGKAPDAPDGGPGDGTSIELRGVAASPGIFRGRARIARSIDEAVALTGEDVLVCVVTAPAWTPVFGIVGAVVTDAGDLLSHPSIVAREYGLPAVVGTRDGTARIPDGAMITVDGDAGVVRVEAE